MERLLNLFAMIDIMDCEPNHLTYFCVFVNMWKHLWLYISKQYMHEYVEFICLVLAVDEILNKWTKYWLFLWKIAFFIWQLIKKLQFRISLNILYIMWSNLRIDSTYGIVPHSAVPETIFKLVYIDSESLKSSLHCV